jgi:SAM-dependent methyltransferase
MSQAAYQPDFSRLHPRMLDDVGRAPKAAKMLAVLEDALGELASLDGLDIGCSGGQLTRAGGARLRSMVGVDIDGRALERARAADNPPQVRFAEGDAMALPFPDGSFDLVLCNHVYEHVPSAERLMAEIDRLLRPAGVCYFAAANRLQIMEPHHRLPLLSWLPKPLAHRYMQLAGRGASYFENHRSLWGLRRLVSAFDVLDYTGRVVREPERFAAGDLLPPGSLRRWLAPRLLPFVGPLLPTYLWLLRKRPAAGAAS